jgi:CHAT domain
VLHRPVEPAHFSGHGRYSPEVIAGELIFQTNSGAPHLVTSEQLAVMLYENDVSLALLNGCDTGVSSTNEALSSVAGALVKAGVPAVVATMREVMDEAATRFSREFYRSFVAGFTVEGCMGEARKALKPGQLGLVLLRSVRWLRGPEQITGLRPCPIAELKCHRWRPDDPPTPIMSSNGISVIGFLQRTGAPPSPPRSTARRRLRPHRKTRPQ